MAWCKLNLGRRDEALSDALAAAQSFGPDCEEEARAAAHGRLAQVFKALDMPAEAQQQNELAQANLQAYRAQQAELLALVGEALKQVP